MAAVKSNLVHSHKPEMDNMSPAMIRVVAEFLLYTMAIEQRRQFMDTLPGFYKVLYPEVELKTPPKSA